ncbi:MAG: hypothetical protein CSA84_03085 [Actinomycetales bacterium]|nr:MAG: hypothetical protein CSA84_03085 [Actinomycetales bacterium]
MTVQQGRDIAHELLMRWPGRVRRELGDIRHAWGDRITRYGMAGTLLIAIGSFSPAALPPANPFRDVPILGLLQTTNAGRIIATTLIVLGVVILLDAWLRLRPAAVRPGLTRGTIWLWSVPLLAAPPLLSFDSYSYAAQGEMVDRGINPYEYGPAVLDGPFAEQVDHFWQFTPAPYGPLSLQVQHLVVDLTGHNPYLSAVLMRVPAFIGVLLIAVYLPRLARLLRYDRESTVWLAVLNPLVVLHFVGGAHNDSLMIGLMVWALWLAATRHLVVGALAVAAAASIKQPAAAAVLAVAALHTWRTNDWEQPTNREVLRHVVPAVAVFVVGFIAIGVFSQLGFGWIAALSVPGSVRSMLAPFTAVGTGLEWVFNQVGWYDTAGASVGFMQKLGTVVGLAVMAWLVWRFKARHPVRTLGWILLAFVITGPVIHPWYLLWGGLIVAMTESELKWRRVVLWVTSFFVFYSTFDAAHFRNAVSSLAATAMVALAWIATGHDKGLNRDLDAQRRRAGS